MIEQITHRSIAEAQDKAIHYRALLLTIFYPAAKHKMNMSAGQKASAAKDVDDMLDDFAMQRRQTT